MHRSVTRRNLSTVRSSSGSKASDLSRDSSPNNIAFERHGSVTHDEQEVRPCIVLSYGWHALSCLPFRSQSVSLMPSKAQNSRRSITATSFLPPPRGLF